MARGPANDRYRSGRVPVLFFLQRRDLAAALLGAIDPAEFTHRNTYIRAYCAPAGVLKRFNKVVYGEVELTHRYEYRKNGVITKAEISGVDEESVSLCYDEAGVRTACV